MTTSPKMLAYLLFSFGVTMVCAAASAEGPPDIKRSAEMGAKADRIVSEYLAQWGRENEAALAGEKAPSSFTDQLNAGMLLLKELKRPGFERTRVAYVLYKFRISIRTVEATIAETETSAESAYLLPSYRQRLEQLQNDAATLERSLAAGAAERPNNSLERTRER